MPPFFVTCDVDRNVGEMGVSVPNDAGDRARVEAVRVIVLSERNPRCFGAALRQYKQRHGLTLLEMRERLRTTTDPLSLEGYATLAAQPLPILPPEIEGLAQALELNMLTLGRVLRESGTGVVAPESFLSDSAF